MPTFTKRTFSRRVVRRRRGPFQRRTVPLRRIMPSGTRAAGNYMSLSGIAGTPKTIKQRAVTAFPLFINRHLNKYFDIAAAVYAFDTTGSITFLPLPTNGDTIATTSGNRAQYNALEFRGIAASNTTTTVAGGAMMIVYDKFPRGVLPAVTDVLLSVSPFAFQNVTYRDRFEILYRRNFDFAGNITAPTTAEVNYRVYGTLRVNRPVTWASAGIPTTIGAIVKGALYFITVGDTAAGTAAAQINLAFRHQFSTFS